MGVHNDREYFGKGSLEVLCVKHIMSMAMESGN